MRPPITVIIPNFNGAALLRKNLPSVLAALQNYPGASTLIVVDDGSSDQSVEVLKDEFPQAEVVLHPENKGFAEAIHTGVNAARTELLFLLNSDVALSPDIFVPLVTYFEDESTFSVNPLIYDERGQVKPHSWNLRQFRGGTLKLMKWSLEHALLRRKQGEKLATAYAHGGSFMVRRSMFLALGGFHPIFKPFYSEDYDLGLRAWRRGWGSYFEPTVHIVHQSQGSIRSNAKWSHIKTIRRRNRYILEWGHLGSSDLLLKALPASALQLLGELLTLSTNNLRGFGKAFKMLGDIRNYRRENNEKSLYTLREVLEKLKLN